MSGSRGKGAVAALWAVLTFALVACGEDEADPPGPDATTAGPIAALGGERAPIAAGSFERLIVTDAVVTPERTSLIIGHLLFEDGAQAAGTKLRLLIGDSRAREAEDAVVRSEGSVARVISCLCTVPTDAGDIEIQVKGSDPVKVAGSSLVVVDDVEGGGGGEGDLPAPLSAAAVVDDPPDIDAEPAALISAGLENEAPDDAPILVVGTVQSASAAADLSSVQVDAAIGEAVTGQPVGTFARPGKYAGIYSGTLAGDERAVGLVSSTASGTVPLQDAAVFACEGCTLRVAAAE